MSGIAAIADYYRRIAAQSNSDGAEMYERSRALAENEAAVDVESVASTDSFVIVDLDVNEARMVDLERRIEDKEFEILDKENLIGQIKRNIEGLNSLYTDARFQGDLSQGVRMHAVREKDHAEKLLVKREGELSQLKAELKDLKEELEYLKQTSADQRSEENISDVAQTINYKDREVEVKALQLDSKLVYTKSYSDIASLSLEGEEVESDASSTVSSPLPSEEESLEESESQSSVSTANPSSVKGSEVSSTEEASSPSEGFGIVVDPESTEGSRSTEGSSSDSVSSSSERTA